MSYKNNEDEFSTSYTKCAGFGFCACCNEVICSDNESNNTKSIECCDDSINENNKDIKSR
jgi:hypothetical protein